MAGEYQFSLIDVTKQVGTKTILKDVCLSFFYGAHIGVIGGNGAGKSSLLKILAGIDTDILGTCQVAKGTKVGYLPQEPELDDSKTVGQVLKEKGNSVVSYVRFQVGEGIQKEESAE